MNLLIIQNPYKFFQFSYVFENTFFEEKLRLYPSKPGDRSFLARNRSNDRQTTMMVVFSKMLPIERPKNDRVPNLDSIYCEGNIGVKQPDE